MYVHATHVFAQRPAAPQAGSPPQFSRIFKTFETEQRCILRLAWPGADTSKQRTLDVGHATSSISAALLRRRTSSSLWPCAYMRSV